MGGEGAGGMSKKKRIENDLLPSQTKVIVFSSHSFEDSIPIHFLYYPFQGLE